MYSALPSPERNVCDLILDRLFLKVENEPFFLEKIEQVTDTFQHIVREAERQVAEKKRFTAATPETALYVYEIRAYVFYLKKADVLPSAKLLARVARILASDTVFFEKKLHETLSAPLKKMESFRNQPPDFIDRYMWYIRSSIEKKDTDDILTYLMLFFAENLSLTEREKDFILRVSRNQINAYRLAFAMKNKNEPWNKIFWVLRFTLLA